MSTSSVVSKLQCAADCRYTEGCVAVALDQGTGALKCALLHHQDFPGVVAPCDAAGASVVIYKHRDFQPTTTTTATTTTTSSTSSTSSIGAAATTAALDPLTSCHCVRDMGVSTDLYSEALQLCTNISGHLPEVDVHARLADFHSGDGVWMGARRRGPDAFEWPSGRELHTSDSMWLRLSGYDCVQTYQGQLVDVECAPNQFGDHQVKCVTLAETCAGCQSGVEFSFVFQP